MLTVFNFPNGVSVEYDLDVVPRVGEMVNLMRMYGGQLTEQEWANFQPLIPFTWEVERVVWTPGRSSFVNLILKRVMEASS